jgi:peroxiredoxin
MALTPSNMLKLGTKAPDFSLVDVISNESLNLDKLKGSSATLIMFICNHCPFVKHINEALSKIGKDYENKGVGIVAISSNDAEKYPEDAPPKLAAQAQCYNFNFPYLYDQDQSVAKAYDAACTPDFFIFDKNLELKYRGQLDDSRPGNDLPVTGRDLRYALDALLNDDEISEDQKPSIGCNIKWKT